MEEWAARSRKKLVDDPNNTSTARTYTSSLRALTLWRLIEAIECFLAANGAKQGTVAGEQAAGKGRYT